MVHLAADDGTLGFHLDRVAVLADDVVARIVDVEVAIDGVVDRADGDGQLGVGARHFRQIHRIIEVWPVNSGTAEEETENVVEGGIDPFEVFIRSEDIVEGDGVARCFEIEFDDAEVVDAAHIEVLADQGRHTVGDVQQVGVTGDFLSIVDDVFEAPSIEVGGVCGHFRAEDEALFDGKLIDVESTDFANLDRASGVLDVGRFNAGSEQDIIDVLFGA